MGLKKVIITFFLFFIWSIKRLKRFIDLKIKGDQKMETKQIQKEGLGIDALIEEAEQ